MIAKFYDKMLFSIAALLLTGSLVWNFLEKPQEISLESSAYGEDFWGKTTDGVYFEPQTEHSLMPGDFLYYREPDESDNNYSSVEIKSINFKRRASVQIQLINGSEVSGRIKAKEGIILFKNWKNTSQIILIDSPDGSKTLQQRDISIISGMPRYFLAEDVDLRTLKSSELQFYQPTAKVDISSEILKKPLWSDVENDQNGTFYDLFTPPLIYLIDGELTTSLPDAPVEEEKKESFGVSAESFLSRPYRFKLGGWIGDTPFLEDIVLSAKFGMKVRNRVEVNKSYKLFAEPKRGQPSLVAADEDDPDKLITLKYFAVQNVPQENGGIKPVGRALVEDKSVRDKPFEINSLMQEVSLGQFSMNLQIKLEGKEKMDFEITEQDIGRVIEYYGRKYKITSFDADQKSVRISKQIGLSPDLETVDIYAP